MNFTDCIPSSVFIFKKYTPIGNFEISTYLPSANWQFIISFPDKFIISTFNRQFGIVDNQYCCLQGWDKHSLKFYSLTLTHSALLSKTYDLLGSNTKRFVSVVKLITPSTFLTYSLIYLYYRCILANKVYSCICRNSEYIAVVSVS